MQILKNCELTDILYMPYLYKSIVYALDPSNLVFLLGPVDNDAGEHPAQDLG